MSKIDFHIKQGDVSPAIAVRLRDGDDPISLEGATVFFKMHHMTGDTVVEGSCVVEDPESGEVAYTWSSGDTDVPGKYHAEFGVDYSGVPDIEQADIDETFPPDRFLKVEVHGSLQ